MKYVRFAVLQFEGDVDLDGISGTHLASIVNINFNFFASIKKTKQDPNDDDKQIVYKTFIHIFVWSEYDITPKLDKDGLFIINNEIESRSVKAIRNISNVLSVFSQTSRQISSPVLTYGLLAETADEIAYFEKFKGFSNPNYSSLPDPTFKINFDGAMSKVVKDRLDGMSILAEALAAEIRSSKFKEFIRFFEHAFSSQNKKLVTPLTTYLSQANLGYSASEIKIWKKLRDPLTHSRISHNVLGSEHVSVHIQRAKQAAYDVLFNKAIWGSNDTSRVENFVHPAGTKNDQKELFLRMDLIEEYRIGQEIQLFDPFGNFPANLAPSGRNDRLLSQLKTNPLPPGTLYHPEYLKRKSEKLNLEVI